MIKEIDTNHLLDDISEWKSESAQNRLMLRLAYKLNEVIEEINKT